MDKTKTAVRYENNATGKEMIKIPTLVSTINYGTNEQDYDDK